MSMLRLDRAVGVSVAVDDARVVARRHVRLLPLALALAALLVATYLLASLLLPASAQTAIPPEVRLAPAVLLGAVVLLVAALLRRAVGPAAAPRGPAIRGRDLPLGAGREAAQDGLTGLADGHAFERALARQVAVAHDRGTPVSLLLLDVDDLRLVNDRQGPAMGDLLLRRVAQALRAEARDEDRLFHTAGDEFAIILPGLDVRAALDAGERILQRIAWVTDGLSCSVTGGLTCAPRFGRQAGLLQRQARAVLARAKQQARGTVVPFEPQCDDQAATTTEAANSAVDEILVGRRLTPVFQPIVDLRSGRVLGFEGFVRPDPRGPLPDPGRLFAAAAAAGRTAELDLACIDVLAEGARAIGPDRLLSLNLSPGTLEARDFDAAWLVRSLVRNGISPGRVVIELAGRGAVIDPSRLRLATAALQRYGLRLATAALQRYGLRLAADDVGVRGADLEVLEPDLLAQVPFDVIKIDLARVLGSLPAGSDSALRSLRDLAARRDARVVAERLETADQLHLVRELHIGAGQGFLLGRPGDSLATTHVDVRSLERESLMPLARAVEAPAEVVAGEESADDGISAERRAIFLPPAAGHLRGTGVGVA